MFGNIKIVSVFPVGKCKSKVNNRSTSTQDVADSEPTKDHRKSKSNIALKGEFTANIPAVYNNMKLINIIYELNKKISILCLAKYKSPAQPLASSDPSPPKGPYGVKALRSREAIADFGKSFPYH